MKDSCCRFVQVNFLFCNKLHNIINTSPHRCDTDHETVEADGAVCLEHESGLAGVDGPLLPGVDVASQRQQGERVGTGEGGGVHMKEVHVLLELREFKRLKKNELALIEC